MNKKNTKSFFLFKILSHIRSHGLDIRNCKSGNFSENLIFTICVKKHICDCKNSRLWQDVPMSVNDRVRKRICATTCYLNPSEKDCFLAKMSEISGFDAIIFRIFKYIAFR